MEQTLRARAYAEKPQGFVLFDDGVFLAFKENELPSPKDETSETVTVTAEATLYGALFDENVLGVFIAEKLSLVEEGTHAAVTNLSELDFKIIDKENFNPEDDAQFSFTMKGKPHFVWEFDAEKLREELKGVKKSNLAAVLAEFPSITRAEVTFRPFWKRSFPDEVKDIVIESISD